jgi:hypothetical protein
MVVQEYNSSSQDVEAGGLWCFRPARLHGGMWWQLHVQVKAVIFWISVLSEIISGAWKPCNETEHRLGYQEHYTCQRGKQCSAF